MSTFAVQVLQRVVLPVAVLLGVMIGLGVLVTDVWRHTWPFTVEDGVNREFAGDRSAGWNDVSQVFSTLADTPVIIAVTVLVAIVLRLTARRWREPVYLAAVVTAQAVVFFFATLVIDRGRPDVVRMDASPPTSSFPSGHTSAAVGLYAGLALVLALTARRGWVKALCWALLLVPLGVALSRLYRGMHHPSDVVASFLNGAVCIAIMARAVLDRGVRWVLPARRRSLAGSATRP
jgi:undecaprenyl-diphosphatase